MFIGGDVPIYPKNKQGSMIMTNFGKWINENECHMDDFGDSILNNQYIDSENLNIVSEAGLSRLISKYKDGKGTFAIISAYRNEENGKKLTKKDKIKRNRKLRTELNALKMGVYQLVGHWRECSDQDVEYEECSKKEGLGCFQTDH